MDRKLFQDESAVLERSKEYASKMKELHIVVFSLKKHNLKAKKIDNLYIYPTNSSTRITFLFDAYRLGKKIIVERGFARGDSVITVQDPMTIIGYLLSKKYKFPIQIQLHTDIFDPNFKMSLVSPLNFWYTGFVHVPLSDFFIPKADRIRVVSENIKNSLERRFRNIDEKIDVLPVYVDINTLFGTYPKRDIKKDFPQFSKIILMASRLSSEKRIDVALHVFEKVLEKVPKAGLVICGEGPEFTSLSKKAKELEIEKSVVFLPWQEDLVSYYKTADVFLLTSEYEGYGMTMIEAGASGCPMVVTRVGVAKSVLFRDGKNSFVCHVGDTQCLSSGVIELLENPTKRDSFKQEMQDSISNISKTKEEYVKEYVSLLEKLLK